MRLKLRFSSERAFLLLAIWVWAQTILVSYIRAFVMRVPLIGTYPDAVMTIAFLTILIAAIPAFRLSKWDILFVLAVIVVYFLNWLSFGAQKGYLEKGAVPFLLKVLPLYLVGASIGRKQNCEEIIYSLYLVSILTIPVTIVYKTFFVMPMSAVTSQYVGDMVYAYDLLPHLCLIVYFAVKRTNTWNILLAVVGGAYLMLQGTRGAVLLYLLMVCLMLIIGKTSKWVIVRTIAIFGAVMIFLMSPLFDAFVLFMYQKAQSFGLSVRIFDKILSGEAANSIGRDHIREQLLQSIAGNPILGYGVYGDRAITGTYAHNIVIEFWTDFGVIFGSLLFMVLVYRLYKGYRQATGENKKGLILALICAGLGQLFLSGSYLDSRMLFLVLGLCVTQKLKLCKQEKAEWFA